MLAQNSWRAASIRWLSGTSMRKAWFVRKDRSDMGTRRAADTSRRISVGATRLWPTDHHPNSLVAPIGDKKRTVARDRECHRFIQARGGSGSAVAPESCDAVACDGRDDAVRVDL